MTTSPPRPTSIIHLQHNKSTIASPSPECISLETPPTSPAAPLYPEPAATSRSKSLKCTIEQSVPFPLPVSVLRQEEAQARQVRHCPMRSPLSPSKHFVATAVIMRHRTSQALISILGSFHHPLSQLSCPSSNRYAHPPSPRAVPCHSLRPFAARSTPAPCQPRQETDVSPGPIRVRERFSQKHPRSVSPSVHRCSKQQKSKGVSI